MQFIIRGSLFCVAIAVPTGVALAQGLPVDTGSHIPVMLWFIGAGILGLAIAYGVLRNRHRSIAEKQMTDDATKELYRSEERHRREHNRT